MLTSTALAAALVVGVVDGDTIKVKYDNGVIETVRLLGIDTPETKRPGSSVECYGPEATRAAREYMLGKHVKLESDQSQSDLDRYNRRLRYVWLGNELINERLVRNGFAQEYTYKKPYKYKHRLIDAQWAAMYDNVGMWGACK